MEALLVGITLAVAIAVTFFLRKKMGRQDTHYDEMQLKIRSDGYRLGFFSVVAVIFVLIFLYSFEGGIATIIEPSLSMFIAVMAGIVIFVVYCIRKEAFFRIEENAKSRTTLLLLMTILNGAIGILRIADGTLWENGVMKFTQGGSNLVLSISFLIILIVLLVEFLRRKDAVTE